MSVYIKKEKQAKYYTTCLDAGLNLKALSLGILSADYLAREKFEANKDFVIIPEIWNSFNDLSIR